ncbi:MAG: zinc-dependent metalloprotease, partial [Rhodothermales bacterium]|nr:zinc-dependent metalloprotease [Rhodothermales bacterium]
MRTLNLIIVLLLLSTSGCASSQKMPDQNNSNVGQEKSDSDKPKAFSEVISEDFESDEGLFRIHQDDGKVFYEIPDSLLGEELLLVSRIAATADNIGYGGMKANTQVVRWERQDDKILLRIVSYENVADEDEPIFEAVRNSNVEPIVMAFEIESASEDSAGVVIDVSNLFLTDVPVLGLQKSRRDLYKVTKLDADRSYIKSVSSYPENIEVRHVLTYSATAPPSNSSTGAITIEMNQSMVLLPAEPMQPRYCDQRVGYFSVRMTDYGLDAQKAKEVCYVTRWRLEPSDTEAYDRGELVEPVKPIVYYIDPATPMKWRPYLKQGVEDWNIAFENAGFKNAIIAKDPPSKEEDPEFSPEDVRYSVIRYFSSNIQNAFGPHVHDPRSGEILESDIGWYHNVMNLLRNWFFVQTSASNPDSRGVEFSDEVMGELIRFVSAHEVGHTIGLPHNWGSSYAYPVDSLRSPMFTSTHGTAPSIMDYARFNYVAQPEDGVTSFYPAIGEYDLWSIKWGYSTISSAADADSERQILNDWVKERAGNPEYFYGRQSGARIDPRSQSEDLGNDAVLASTYGLANLKRIIPELRTWTDRPGEDYSELDELYGQVVTQWGRYLAHVGRNIGGVYENYKTYDQDGLVYDVVPEAIQKQSMQWLHENGFNVPYWLMEGDVLDRIQHAGALDRIRRTQVSTLDVILEPSRLARLIEADVRFGDEVYGAQEMLQELRRGIWMELRNEDSIHAVRRNLQNGYLDRMKYLMSEDASG